MYNPPGTGFKSVSKVVEFVTRRADRARTSFADRYPKLTPCSCEETGCEGFMADVEVSDSMRFEWFDAIDSDFVKYRHCHERR